METTKFTIENGPNKMDLGIALFKGRKEIDDVDFKTNLNGKNFLIQCSVQSVEMADGSHESWNITGNAKFPEDLDPGRPRRKFTAYYHTVKRTGHLHISI